MPKYEFWLYGVILIGAFFMLYTFARLTIKTWQDKEVMTPYGWLVVGLTAHAIGIIVVYFGRLIPYYNFIMAGLALVAVSKIPMTRVGANMRDRNMSWWLYLTLVVTWTIGVITL